MNWNEVFNQEWVGDTIYSVIILIGALVLSVVVDRGFNAVEKGVPIPKMGLMMARRLLRYLVFGLGLVLVLERWGMDMKTVLAVVGGLAGMVAIGFVAVWSVLSNMSCAFVLSAFRPFSIGDQVEIPADGVSGKVIDVNLLFVTLKCEEDDYVQVPNNTFIQKVFRCKKGKQSVTLRDQLMRDEPAE